MVCGIVTPIRHPVRASMTSIAPPCNSTAQRAIASPRPVPPADVAPRVKRWKTRSRSAGGMPGPSSQTSSRRPAGSARDAEHGYLAPAGLCRMALSTRLTTTCRRRAGSATATRSGGDSRHHDVDAVGRGRDVRHGVAQEFVDREITALQRNRPAFEAGQVEQVGDQFAESLGLRQRHPHRLGVRFGDAVDDVLQHRVQGRDRACAVRGRRWRSARAGSCPRRRGRPPSG